MTEEYRVSGREFARRLMEGIEDPTKRNIGAIKLKEDSVIPLAEWDYLGALRQVDQRPPNNYVLDDADLKNIHAGARGLGGLWMPYLSAKRMKAFEYSKTADFDLDYMPNSDFEGVPENERESYDGTTDLRCTRWIRANLSNSNLRYVHFRDAWLCGTNLIGADMTGAIVYGTRFWEAKLVDPEDPTKTVKNLDKTDGLGHASFWRKTFHQLRVTRDLRDIILQARKVADKEMFKVVD